MKNNQRRLAQAFKIWGYKAFYSCNVTEYSVTLQGRYNPEVVMLALKFKFTHSIESNGYVKLTRNHYEIILTN